MDSTASAITSFSAFPIRWAVIMMPTPSFLVMISFILFNAASVGEALQQIGGLFGLGGIPLFSAEAVYYLKSYGIIFLIAIIGATPIPKKLAEKCKFTQWVEPVVLAGLLMVITAYLVDGSFNPFLYFRF